MMPVPDWCTGVFKPHDTIIVCACYDCTVAPTCDTCCKECTEEKGCFICYYCKRRQGDLRIHVFFPEEQPPGMPKGPGGMI